MQKEARVFIVRVDVEVVYPVGVKGRRPSYYSVNFVAFRQKVLRKIRAVLTRYACNKSFLQSLSLQKYDKIMN